jgi:ceramide glucosyltransferase
MLLHFLTYSLFALAALGCLYMFVAALIVPTFARRDSEPRASTPAITLLKPLHGAEPGLYANLASFCQQDYPGPLQIVFGVTHAHDPAIAVVERLKREFPACQIDLVVDGRAGGTNPKVANLINMNTRARHDIIVLADSDIRVDPDYLTRVYDALEQAGDGAVTGLYFGIPAGGLWSQLSQLNVNGHFLPGVMTSVRLHLAEPCLGSTIAMYRSSLAAVGGFEAVANCLADDHALGEALRDRGEPVTVLPFAVGHMCNETSFGELWRHELRWARTIRGVDPSGYAGWVINHAFALALLAFALGGGATALWLAATAIAGRAALLYSIENHYGLPRHPYWLIPLRDLLSFAVYVAGFVTRDVDWRGHRYHLVSEGTLISEQRSTIP